MRSRSNSRKNKAQTTGKEITSRKRKSESSTESQKTKLKSSPHLSLKESGWNLLEKLLGFRYFESPHGLDKPDYVFVETVNLLDNNKGYGLYAATDIPAVTILGEYTGELKKPSNKKSDYGMNTDSGLVCDAEKKGNLTRFANYSEHQANARFSKIDINGETVIVLETLRAIKAGEQILVNYNVYQENANKYFFFDGMDSWKSSIQHVQEHQNDYSIIQVSEDYPSLDLEQDNDIYVSEIGSAIFKKKNLSDIDIDDSKNKLHLRFIKIDQETHIAMEYAKYDTFNALMLACYLGQVDNVDYLLKAGIDANKQQTISGQSALFFAVLGYKDAKCTAMACRKIILNLIQHQANIYIQNKKDQCFYFSLMKHLDVKDVKYIFDALAKTDQYFYKKMLEYINEQKEDAIYYSIRHKRLSVLEILLNNNPGYLNKYIVGSNDQDTKFCYRTDKIKQTIQDYTEKEHAQLKKIFITNQFSFNLLNEIFESNTQNLKGYQLKKFDHMPTPANNKKSDNDSKIYKKAR